MKAEQAGPALVLAPRGRDADVARRLLCEIGIAASACADVAELAARLDKETAFAVVTEEALREADLGPLVERLAAQPSWSDLPFVVITSRGSGLERNPAAQRLSDALGHVVFVERPFRPMTFASVARIALRSRRRQYEARARLAELRNSAARLATAYRITGLGTFEWDVTTGVLDMDGRAREIFGLPAEGELRSEDVLSRIVPADVDRVRAEASMAAGRRAQAELLYDIVLPDGTRRSVHSTGDVIEDEGGPRMIGVVNDVTERKRAEALLLTLNADLEREVKARTRERDRIWEVSRDMLAVSDAGGVMLSVNPAWTKTLGWRTDALLGRTLEWLRHADDLQNARDELARLAAGEETSAFEDRLRARDGSWRTLSWTAVPEAGRIYMVARDVTAEKERAEALALAERALRQSQKMEAVGHLTGGIAHDFNNVLGAVIAGFNLILRRPGDAERVARIAREGRSAAERGAKLTGQLLTFSRSERIELKPLSVAAVVEGMGEMLGRTLGPAIRLEFDLDERPVLVLSDPVQLEMSVLNLAINARDAMCEGGVLRIASRVIAIREDAELPDGEYVELSVADTGAGMPADVVARAFEPFFTTKDVGKGTGLGLSQVYGVARQAGGSARIESTPGAGTVVKLLLPLWEGAMPRDEPRPPSETRCRLERQRVLIVDDDADFRGMLRESLREIGCVVMEASDGAAGLAALEAAPVDLMLVDFAMPGMNGAEVAAAAWASRPDLPVLFASGYADTAAIEAVAGPDVPILRKPFSLEDLEAAIDAVLRRKRAAQ